MNAETYYNVPSAKSQGVKTTGPAVRTGSAAATRSASQPASQAQQALPPMRFDERARATSPDRRSEVVVASFEATA